jgi:riboflavin synthase
MFTGIVAGTGEIKNINKFQRHSAIEVKAPFSLKGTRRGDSIALDGCCLTITKKIGRNFTADVSPETLAVTTLGGLKRGQRVNLELPLRASDRLGGHWVQGHVDGVGRLAAKHRVLAQGQKYYLLEVVVPSALHSYMVPKGSVTIDGISLTINRVKKDRIELCIIPHTQGRTTLTVKGVGASVNIEADCLLKFIEQRLKNYFPKQPTKRRKKK